MLRQIVSSEREAVVEVLRESFATVVRDFGLTPENCPTNAAFIDCEALEHQIREGLRLYGYFEGRALAGVVGVKQLDSESYTIDKLAVLPVHRHQGIGVRLLNYALRVICDAGGSEAHIGIIDENKVLKEWYQKHGFVEGEAKDFPQLPFRVCFMDKAVSTCG